MYSIPNCDASMKENRVKNCGKIIVSRMRILTVYILRNNATHNCSDNTIAKTTTISPHYTTTPPPSPPLQPPHYHRFTSTPPPPHTQHTPLQFRARSPLVRFHFYLPKVCVLIISLESRIFLSLSLSLSLYLYILIPIYIYNPTCAV